MKRFAFCGAAGVFVAVLFTSIPAQVTGQGLSPEVEAQITELFADFDFAESPGASVAVIRHGEIIYSRGFGSAQLEYGIPVTPSTIFHVASVSKQFTAMAVLLLAAEGKLGLDDDVRSYMPEVPDLGAVITPRHLLQHTSGVRDQWELLIMSGWRFSDVITKEDVRSLLSKQRELNFEPGSRYLYSNMGFSLAADLVERVAGMPFQDFVQERIFEPLGMEGTHVHDDHQHVVPNRAYSYAAVDDGFENRVLSYANHGATSLFTTAEDLVTWLDNFRTADVGSPELFETMQTRAVLTSGDTVGYALGVSVARFRGLQRVGHSGADAGFRSSVSWFPEHELGIAVLTNLASGDPVRRDRDIAMILLEDELLPVPEEGPDEADSAGDIVHLTPQELAVFEGRFPSPIGVAEFEVRAGDLWAVSPDTARLTPTSSNTFEADDFPVALTFHVSEVADSVTLLQRESGISIVARREITPPDFMNYVGHYYSPEIEAIYEVRRTEDGLSVYHIKLGEVAINYEGAADRFGSTQYPIGSVRFTRDESGDVDGFRLTQGRVLNLRFVRMDGGLPR